MSLPFSRLALVACLAWSATAASASTVLNFDNLAGTADMAGSAHGGFDWLGWVHYDYQQAGMPYNPASPDTRLTTSSNVNAVSRRTPFVFEGAYISGFAEAMVHYEMWFNGVLVSTSAVFSPSASPTFLASGYYGTVDSVVVVSDIPNYFVLDDFSYSEPSTGAAAPQAAAWVTATVASPTSVTLSWVDNSLDETSFVLQQAPVSNGIVGPYSAIATVSRNAAESAAYGATLTSTVTALVTGQTYAWRVVTANAAFPIKSASPASTSLVVQATPTVALPAAPGGLAAAARSSSATALLSWTDKSDSETSFTINRSADGGLSWNMVASVIRTPAQALSTGTVASYSDSTAPAGTASWYQVLANNDGGSSAASNTLLLPAMPGPAAPTGLSAVAATSGTVTVSWVDASTDETSFVVQQAPVTGGVVGGFATVATYARTAAQTTATGGAALSHVASGLSAGQTYAWRVVAANAVFAQAATATSVIVQATATGALPAAPTGLAAAARSTSATVVLSWTDASTSETGFNVQRSADAGVTWTAVGSLTRSAAQTAATGGTAVSFSDTTALPGSAYQYRVTASNAGGASAPSNTVAVSAVPAPTAPTGVAATVASATGVTLVWTDASIDETSFVVQQATVTGGVVGSFSTVSTVVRSGSQTTGTGGTALSFSAAALTSGQAYAWRVVAANGLFPVTSAPASAISAAVLATPQVAVPAAPTGLAAAARSTSATVVLSWNDASTTETGFAVQRSADAGATWAALGSVTPTAAQTSSTGTAFSYSDATALAASAYQYRVTASNAGGASAASNTVSVAAIPGPAAASGVTAKRASSSSVTVQWIDASNNETGFALQRAVVSAGKTSSFSTVTTVSRTSAQSTTTGGTALSFSDKGLSTGTTYAWRVVTVNALFPAASAPAASISSTVTATP